MQQGDVLRNRYRITRPLGQGGFAEVCLAEDLYFQREVAVKKLLPGAGTGSAGGAATAPSPELLGQFLEEARLLSRLAHPNLPKVVDFFEDGGTAAIVMDYIAGETLEQIVKRRGPLPESEVLAWTRQVCDALEYLHALSPPVIVRDLKPDNLIVANGQVYLIDFGIAKVGDASTMTRTVNRSVGTPGYCPPEQYGPANRKGATCPQSDYYALGGTLVYLLTGSTPPDVMERVSHAVPVPEVTKANPSATPRTRDAIWVMMELDVAKRPATVDQVRGLLGIGGGTASPTGVAPPSIPLTVSPTSTTPPPIPLTVSLTAVPPTPPAPSPASSQPPPGASSLPPTQLAPARQAVPVSALGAQPPSQQNRVLVILLVIIAAGLFAFMVLARRPNHGGGKPARPAPAASEQVPASTDQLPDSPGQTADSPDQIPDSPDDHPQTHPSLPAGLPGTPADSAAERPDSPPLPAGLPGTPAQPRSRAYPGSARPNAQDAPLPGTPVR